MTRCRWVVDGGIRFHVPECWGTVHDPYGDCHCPSNEISVEDRLDRIEEALAAITKELAK